MAFKKEGLWYPCQLKAPRVAVFWLGANFRSDKTITRHLSTQCGAFTSSLSQTIAQYLHMAEVFVLFYPAQDRDLSVKLCFLRNPSGSLPAGYWVDMELFLKSSKVLLSGGRKGRRLHISIFHPWPTVWFHTTHRPTGHSAAAKKALMHSYSDSVCPPVQSHICTLCASIHALL